jgi:hypothetical protein
VSIWGRGVRFIYRRAEKEGVRRGFMRKTNHRAGVAAILVGAVLFSPLLCGMTCFEARGVRPNVAAEAAPAAGEFVAQFAERAVVGCLLTQVVLNIDFSGWEDVFTGGAWIWVGVEAMKLIGAIERVWRG